jgi:hypothetical protein
MIGYYSKEMDNGLREDRRKYIRGKAKYHNIIL